MKLSEAVRWMSLNGAKVQLYLAKRDSVSKGSISMTREIKPTESLEIARAFPEHTKRLILSCDENDRYYVQMVGDWNGRLMRGANRVLNKCYRTWQDVLRQDRDGTRISTSPPAEELREERIKQRNEQKNRDAEWQRKKEEEEMEIARKKEWQRKVDAREDTEVYPDVDPDVDIADDNETSESEEETSDSVTVETEQENNDERE